MSDSLKIRLLSSLSKVFADEEISDMQWDKGSMLSNEVFSFQVAYCWLGDLKREVSFHISSELSQSIQARIVSLVPSEMPCYADHDENILRTTPGLYPDLLLPAEKEMIDFLPNQWRSIWITINTLKEKINPGTYSIKLVFYETADKELGNAVFQLEVLDAMLPKQKLLHTEWFHTDCIATYYGLEIFSEDHWKRIEQFVQTAVNHGINMILTPLFTPPLDTAVGGERPTVQLVDVDKIQDKYRFGFDKLKRWIDLCRANGVEYFEFSHLFTQWGAKHAPKIIATVDGECKQIFGWESDSVGEQYSSFLSQFLPELLGFVMHNNLQTSCYFHVSDEPSTDHYDNYKKASNILNEYLKEYPIIDALSDYKFYETGVVQNPIPAIDCMEEFLENNVPGLWTYYCCGQYKKVSNRFFNMPSVRTRFLGIQLYKFNIKGFLHWGYNFWYSMFSKHPIDPFRVTDASYGFPSGDAFVVYPGVDGPLESLRLEVLYEGLQDLRALQLLEELIGREAVLKLLEEELEYSITFSRYPKETEWLLAKREQINRRIIKALI